jgi:hypothetical protein
LEPDPLPTFAQNSEPGAPAPGCDLTLERRGDGGRRLLTNGALENADPVTDVAQLLVWAPLPSSSGAIAAFSDDPDARRSDLGAGVVASLFDFFQMARGPMRALRVLQSEAEARCCGSRFLVELSSDELTYRSTVHQPLPVPPAELLDLEVRYPPRSASEWAVCDWNSQAVDPVDPAGLLLVNSRHDDPADGAALYVLWRDVDGFPRGWEAFDDAPDPSALDLALDRHFRYAARDQEFLVVDRSPVPRLGQRAALTHELVSTVPMAAPPLPHRDA